MTGIYVLAVLLGLIPAVIARNKNRSFAAWWLFGAALFVVALPAALIVGKADPDPERYKRCPDCREWIDRYATRCSHCGVAQRSSR